MGVRMQGLSSETAGRGGAPREFLNLPDSKLTNDRSRSNTSSLSHCIYATYDSHPQYGVGPHVMLARSGFRSRRKYEQSEMSRPATGLGGCPSFPLGSSICSSSLKDALPYAVPYGVPYTAIYHNYPSHLLPEPHKGELLVVGSFVLDACPVTVSLSDPPSWYNCKGTAIILRSNSTVTRA
ncbi:hypothetical protein K458DRAFT_410563 [Lentithecium fluviatile CBS 122367]|uniref:Uncharacterized protein n=1 Tax=Lentithecium fluviatile CBS 122367 TaxID=1168545 RepID=A0A6G1IE22_9PLEO|nr:hypothetical protein K458DRAFT_410563 [Lentithecium fluviatile CBS 122367]